MYRCTNTDEKNTHQITTNESEKQNNSWLCILCSCKLTCHNWAVLNSMAKYYCQSKIILHTYCRCWVVATPVPSAHVTMISTWQNSPTPVSNSYWVLPALYTSPPSRVIKSASPPLIFLIHSTAFSAFTHPGSVVLSIIFNTSVKLWHLDCSSLDVVHHLIGKACPCPNNKQTIKMSLQGKQDKPTPAIARWLLIRMNSCINNAEKVNG